MRQLAARIPFEGVAQRDALRTPMKFIAMKLRICENQVNSFTSKIVTIDFENLKSVGVRYLSLDLIYHSKGYSQKLFS
jgi:hypothetical protein